MKRFTFRKSLLVGVVLSMLILLLQYKPLAMLSGGNLSAAGIVSGPPAAVIPPAHLKMAPAAVRKLSKTLSPAALEPVVKTLASDQMNLHLNPNAREYNVILSGQVSCNHRPCVADLELGLDTTRDANAHTTFQTMEDGTFWFQVPLTEVMHEQVNWKLTAQSGDLGPTERRGNRILMEDRVIAIEVNLDLQ